MDRTIVHAQYVTSRVHKKLAKTRFRAGKIIYPFAKMHKTRFRGIKFFKGKSGLKK